MRKIYSLLFALVLLGTAQISAQITVTNPGNTTPALSATYTSLANAITDVNNRTAISGPVTITLSAAQTAPAGGYVIQNTAITGGSNTNRITFDGGGQTVTTGVGTSTTNDAIIKIIGTDFITIQNFVLNEAGTNVTATTQVEWGIAVLYATTTNGSQGITLQSNTITLNRTNINTFGIYSNSTHTNAAPTTSATATTAAGGNSNLKIYSNTISNVNMGILVVGPTPAADANTGVEIGGASLGNTITNFGTSNAISSYANVSGTVNGILIRNSNGFTISNNSITSSAGGVTAGTLNGIQVAASSNAPTTTFTNNINSNTLALQSGLAGGAINGINYPSGSASSTSVLNINSNNFTQLNHSVSGTAAIIGILLASTNLTTSISSNTFTNITTNTTNSFTFISASYTAPANGTKTVNGNSIVTAFSKTGSGGTVQLYLDGGSSTNGTTVQNNNNNFSNITLTGSTIMAGWFNNDGTGSTPAKTITGNTFSNWTCGSGAVNVLQANFGGSTNMSSNTISSVTGGSTITAINQGSSGTIAALTIASNSITSISSTGGTVVGIASAIGATTVNVNDNIIRTLSSSTSNATGITLTAGATVNMFKNTICDLSGNAASSVVTGLAATGTTNTIYNNRIADLRTPNANAGNTLVGISITGGTTINIYYNTVYLNGTSAGALFGSSAISVSTTPTVTLRNNIFHNASGTAGAGLAVAYRRSGTTLTSYGANSNNNNFFGSTIFTDGTNTDAAIGAYKIRVSSRDASSFSENTAFLSTTCGNASFLKINTATPTQLESGGVNISGITDDFEGDIRNVSTPDIGADEFAGTAIDLIAPSITTVTLVGNACDLVSRTVTAVISDASGVDNALFQPRIYFRKNAGAYSSAAGSLSSGTVNSGTWSFVITYATLGGVTAADVVDYFIVAQDINGNTGGNPSAGLVLTNVNTVSVPPTTPLSYTIQNSLSGTYTVGAAGTYTTLTAAIAAYNSSCLAGAVTFSLLDAAYTEAAAMTINANSDASATNTLTIKPTQANTTIAVTGGSATAVFVLNGADYVTINGSTSATANTVCPLSAASRDLTITNTSTSTSSAVVWLQTATGSNAATNNAVINCNLVGNSNTQTLFGVGSGSTTISTASTGTGNNNNTFVNNNISKTQFGIFTQGASAGNKNTGTVINQNSINTVSPNNVQIGGIYVGFDNGATISGNSISGMVSSTDAFGISTGVTSWVATTAAGNEVSNAVISKNTIGLVQNTGTNSAAGILVGPSATGTNQVSNNMVYGVIGNSTPGDLTAGIFTICGAGATQVYYNTVSMTGDRGTGTSASSIALAVMGTNPTIDIRNNILVNKQTTASTGKSYAIGLGYSTFTNLTSNNNDFFTSGANANFGVTGTLNAGTDRTSLALWQTATTTDAASLNIDPVFVSASDLHLVPASNATLNNLGTPLSVADDIDCQTRSLTTPDMGADEFAAPDCTGATGGTAAGDATFCGSGTPTITAAGFSSGNTTSYQWYSSTVIGDYPNAGTAVGGQTNPSALTTGVVSTTTYYWLRVTCTAASATDNSTLVTITVNPNPGAVTVDGAGTFCTSTSITATGGTGGTIYFQGTTSGGTSIATPSISESVTASGTYFFRAQTALGCWGAEGSTAVVIQTDPVITGTPVSICVGGTGSLEATAANSCAGFANSGTTLSGTLTAATDPVALRLSSMDNSATCAFDGAVTRNYTAQQFQVSVTGNYIFNMTASSLSDNMGYIMKGTFTPGVCPGDPADFVRGDDDDGTGNLPRLGQTGVGAGTMTLTTGVTYTLITLNYSATSGTASGTYTWTITPPGGGQLMLPANGTIDWYTVASGGTSIGSGSPFNPVPAGLANTNTPGTTTFYAACSNASTCRTAVNFVINPNYDIVATSGANGTVAPLGTTTLSCDGTGDQSYTITPDFGYLISDLVVDGVSNTALTTGSYALGGTYDFVNVTANHTIHATFTLAACINNTFSGTGNWSDNARWSCGAPPNSGDNVTIAAGANATLDVDFTVAGSLVMTATSTLTVNPTRTLTVSGTADFAGQSVTFKSDNTGTASLGEVTGTVSNATNVTVERYIPNNNFRSWRLLSVPVTTSQTIRQAWQEGDANPLPRQNNVAGYGTQITGVFGTQAAAAAAGFDSTTVLAGMLRWNGASWSNITSTNQAINNFGSYFLYIRGDRSLTVTGMSNSSNATTLRTKGTIFTGDQVTNIGANAFALVPNRYPSAINFTGLTRTGGVSNLFYIWDSKKLNGSSLGMYQTFSNTNSFNCLISGGSYVLGQPNTTIESGQSFFVQSTTAGSITLKEAAKVGGGGSLGFRPSAIKSKIDSRLYNSNDEMLDANTVVFDAVYSKAVADEDAPKMGNPGANFAIETGSKLLAIEGTTTVKEGDAIQFRMWNMAAGNYKLEFALSNLSLPAGTEAILEDSYTKTNTVLTASAATNVNFTVDASTASSAANRFRIVIGKAGVYNKAGFTIAPNPIEGNTMNLVFSQQAAGKYSVRIVAANGQAVSTYRLTHAGGSANQVISLPAVMGNGTYTVEIVAPDKARTAKSVLVNRK